MTKQRMAAAAAGPQNKGMLAIFRVRTSRGTGRLTQIPVRLIVDLTDSVA